MVSAHCEIRPKTLPSSCFLNLVSLLNSLDVDIFTVFSLVYIYIYMKQISEVEKTYTCLEVCCGKEEAESLTPLPPPHTCTLFSS
jgi:hypothetical protein